jgi:predicted Fe-Mo cluster-binding NifX family protein
MKVAVSAQSGDLSALIDPRCGRAPWFVVVDIDSGEVQGHDNRRAAAMSSAAGFQAADVVVASGAEAVITGNVGPKAFTALQSAGVDVYLVYTGTVEQVLERFKAGKLRLAHTPTRKGHW